MDFHLSEEQTAVRDLAADLLGRMVTPERLAVLEERPRSGWLDTELWRALGTAGLLGVALPESVGGGGLGFVELALVCEQIGVHAAHAPVWSSIVCAALPIAAFGTPDQVARDLPGVATGEDVLTAALVEVGNDDPRTPLVSATESGGQWILDGEKLCVPLAEVSTRIVVTASTPSGPGLFLVTPDGRGVELEAQTATSLQPQSVVRLTAAAAEPLGSPADDPVDWLVDRALAGLAAVQLGVCERVLRMSADYTTTREQFGRPVATFQAVGHRMADAYADTLALRLATTQAAWLLAEGMPARDAAAVAKWWAAEAGHRVTRAGHHVHGGVGVDVTYPLHRYIRWATQNELLLGGAARQLRVIGERLATEPV